MKVNEVINHIVDNVTILDNNTAYMLYYGNPHFVPENILEKRFVILYGNHPDGITIIVESEV